MDQKPKSVRDAVKLLAGSLPQSTIHLIRGATQPDLVSMHFGLGMWIRDHLGLWNNGSELLISTKTTHADNGSTLILNALWHHLVRTATPEELAASRQIRREYDESQQQKNQQRMDAIAARDAAISNHRCPHCDKPCPSYRKTCKHCGKSVIMRA